MKTNLLSLFAVAAMAFSGSAFADTAKSYQVTGPIVEVNDKMIVVMKGKDRWELDREAATKVTGELKVGEKVTISYTMTAKDIEVKAAKAAKGAAKGKASPAASPSASPKS